MRAVLPKLRKFNKLLAIILIASVPLFITFYQELPSQFGNKQVVTGVSGGCSLEDPGSCGCSPGCEFDCGCCGECPGCTWFYCTGCCVKCGCYSEPYYEGYYEASYCSDSAPAAPSLVSPANGAIIVSSPVTLQWSHSGDWGTNCAGNNNRFQVYMGAGSPSSLVCDVAEGTTSCSVPVSDNTTYQWFVRATNGAVSSDSPTWAFNVLFHAGGWFQLQDSDLTNPGDLISRIPAQCTPPTCTPVFNIAGSGGFPGVPAYGGSTSDFGSGLVSTTGWLANTGYTGRRFDYAYFARRIPSDAVEITSSSVDGASLVSQASTTGLTVFTRTGDLTLTGNMDVGDKDIAVFVSGNLTINGTSALNDGSGFLAFFVGGNIAIDPSVTQAGGGYALEGIYLSDGSVDTGTNSPSADSPLRIRGMVVAWSGVALRRDLDPGRTTGANNQTPAEYVEFAPDLVLTFPPTLLREGILWREVAP